METLTAFADVEVLEDAPPSNWMKIMPSQLNETDQPSQGGKRESTAIAGSTVLMQEDHFWQLTVRDSQRPQPPPRW